MNTQRIKEILEELDGIALKKIYYISSMADQKQIVKDGMNDSTYLQASLRIYLRYEYDIMEKVNKLRKRELELYEELAELTRDRAQA